MTNDKTDINARFNQSGSGEFLDNTTRLIFPINLRNFVASVLGGFVNVYDNAYNGVKGFKPGINTISSLKAISTTDKAVGIVTIFRDTASGDALRVYELVTGTDTESSPDLIRPNDYNASLNAKVWKLAQQTASGATVYKGDYDLQGASDLLPDITEANWKYRIIGTTSSLVTTVNEDVLPQGTTVESRVTNPSRTDTNDWIVTYNLQ